MENSSTKRVDQKYLTDDIWYEIFLRLTLDSIFRFKCVSKLWFSILSNPNFLNKWYKLNIASLPWGFVHDVPLPVGEHERTYKCAFPDLHSRYISHQGFSFRFFNQLVDKSLFLLGSRNGLVLCTPDLFRPMSYYVCNPLTQECVFLPLPPRDHVNHRIVTAFICYSECFSESTSYKVVRIPKFEAPTKEFKVEMFSSDSAEWVVCNVSCPPGATWEFDYSDNYVTNNGVMYWFQKRSNKILAVSVNRNTDRGACGNECSSRMIDMPDLEVNGDDTHILSQFLGESEGLICLARFKKSEESLSVWVLDGDRWYMLHKDVKLHDQLAEMESRLIDGSEGEDVINGIEVGIEVVGFSPVDKNVVILSYKKYIWAYNTRTRVYEQLLHPPFLHNNLNPVHYLRTLAFLFKPRPTILGPFSWDAASLDARYRIDNSGPGFARHRNYDNSGYRFARFGSRHF